MIQNKPIAGDRFSYPTPLSWPKTIRGLFVAINTVIFTPKHDERVIHKAVNNDLRRSPIQHEDDLETILAKISDVFKTKDLTIPKVSAKERMGIFSVLMQFTMYMPKIAPYFRADYNDIETLYQKVFSSKKGSSSADVLRLSLEIKPNLIEALWLTLVTSRQYARWYDEEALINYPPNLTKNKIRARMRKWYLSVKALKQYEPSKDQDSAGDLYYVFTHAIAKVVFGPMSPKWAIDAMFYRTAVHIGTKLNHTIAHKVSPQSVKSDHTIAAQYGNAIGQLIAKALISRS